MDFHLESRRVLSLSIDERFLWQGDEFAQEGAEALEGFADAFVFGGVGGWVFPVSFTGDLHEDAQGVVFGEFGAFAEGVDFILAGGFDADGLIACQFDGDFFPGETVAGVDECLGFAAGGLRGGWDRGEVGRILR